MVTIIKKIDHWAIYLLIYELPVWLRLMSTFTPFVNHRGPLHRFLLSLFKNWKAKAQVFTEKSANGYSSPTKVTVKSIISNNWDFYFYFMGE